jgi:hypothetical protein
MMGKGACPIFHNTIKPSRNPSEAVKKLAACASAHMVECLVEALERGLLNLSHSLIVL